MKTQLLITTCILLVIASPIPREALIPPPHSYDHDISALSIDSRDSGTLVPENSFGPASEPSNGALSSLAKSTGPNHPHHDQPAGAPADKLAQSLEPVAYWFGKDIEEGIGGPNRLKIPAPLPEGLELLNISELRRFATDIYHRSKTIIRRIMDDRNEISRANSFVRGGDVGYLTVIKGLKPLEVPQLPSPVPDNVEQERELLLTMITLSDQQLRKAAYNRNAQLTQLLKNRPLGNIRDPGTNRYLTYLKENRIQVPAKTSTSLEETSTYSFGQTSHKIDVTWGLGSPWPMPNVDQMPRALDKLDDVRLTQIAKDIGAKDRFGNSKFSNVLTEVINDMDTILQAIQSLHSNGPVDLKARKRTFKVPTVPEKGTSSPGVYRAQLLEMIRKSHKRLRVAVVTRNIALSELDKLELPPDHISHPDLTNTYVAYWMETHRQLPVAPVSGANPTSGGSHGTSGDMNVQPPTKKRPAKVKGARSSPKRLKKPSGTPAQYNAIDATTWPEIDATTDPDLAAMLREIDNALRPPAPGPSSPNQSTPGSVSGHHSAAHRSNLPAKQ
ncbi:hypothetical protein H0H93_013436 [Arthromyces matolae]|nr:hypothetical protein H0H93_013436 [Arthromyces matolae]